MKRDTHWNCRLFLFLTVLCFLSLLSDDRVSKGENACSCSSLLLGELTRTGVNVVCKNTVFALQGRSAFLPSRLPPPSATHSLRSSETGQTSSASSPVPSTRSGGRARRCLVWGAALFDGDGGFKRCWAGGGPVSYLGAGSFPWSHGGIVHGLTASLFLPAVLRGPSASTGSLLQDDKRRRPQDRLP